MTSALNTPAPTRVAGIVFDCDGLLVDTEILWTRAEGALFDAHGYPFGAEQKALLIGRSVESAVAELAEYFGRPGDDDAITADLLSRVRAELEAGTDAQPGALDLVRICAARVPVAVASNSPRDLLDLALSRSGLAELLPISVAADEVRTPKPDPELYLAACARLAADPASSVAFEDSRTGAAAARAAGLYLITVPSLPGTSLDHDWQLTTLADPELLAWATQLQAG